MKRFFALLIAIWLLPMNATATTATEAMDPAFAWQTITSYLSWEKYWFGKFSGENCFNRLIGKKVDVTYWKFNAPGPLGVNKVTFTCNHSKRKEVRIGSFLVQVSDTILKYRVLELSDVPGSRVKASSTFVAPYDAHDCKEEGTQLWAEKYRKEEGTTEVKVPQTLKKIPRYKVPTLEEGLHDQRLLNAVRRTMVHYLKQRYFEEPSNGKVKEKFPRESIEKIKASNKLLVARFRETDPYLLVYYPGDGNIYEMDFPTTEILSNDDLCMEVYQTSSYHDVSFAAKQLRGNSIQLDLPNWAN